MKLKIFLLSILSLSIVSSEAFAKKKRAKKTSSYEESYGMAGCGLASTMITEKDRGSQFMVMLLGMTSSSFFISQTSAISSGTSNCVAPKKAEARQEQEVFVNANLASLSKEAAQGEGEHLEALAEVLGCPHSDFTQLSQERYDVIFETYQADAVLNGFLREVQANEGLSKSCIRAG